MIKEELNNIDNPLPNETFTAAQAIEAVNRLLWSEDVEDDDMHDALLIKAFLVGTLPNIPAPVKHSKTIPVMETTIEGAQKRIASIIDNPNLALYGSRVDLEYIGVFLDSVDDEMAAITSSCNSLHDRYVEAVKRKDNALGAIEEWKDNFESVSVASARRLEEKIELQKEIDILKATIASLERQLLAAHDNR